MTTLSSIFLELAQQVAIVVPRQPSEGPLPEFPAMRIRWDVLQERGTQRWVCFTTTHHPDISHHWRRLPAGGPSPPALQGFGSPGLALEDGPTLPSRDPPSR